MLFRNLQVNEKFRFAAVRGERDWGVCTKRDETSFFSSRAVGKYLPADKMVWAVCVYTENGLDERTQAPHRSGREDWAKRAAEVESNQQITLDFRTKK